MWENSEAYEASRSCAVHSNILNSISISAFDVRELTNSKSIQSHVENFSASYDK